MPEPYLKKGPGDMIRAQDWNEMQVEVRTQVEAHAHTGAAGQGVQLSGAAIAADAVLSVKGLAASDGLSVQGKVILEEIDRLTAGIGASLPLAGGVVTGELTAAAGLRLADSDIALRGGADVNHGLGWYGPAKRFAARDVDGPVLYGNAGGALGTTAGQQRAALVWNSAGVVSVGGALGIGTETPRGGLDVSGAVYAGGSDLYFTDTAHNHTGIGNTAGFAALENAQNYGALMILGRAASPMLAGKTGRAVKLWDFLQVNGDQEVTGDLVVRGRVQAAGASRAIAAATNRVDVGSDAWQRLNDMTIGFTTTGGPVLLLFKTGGVQATGGNNKRIYFRLMLDNGEYGRTAHEFHNNGWELRDVCLFALPTPARGYHTAWVEWLIQGGGVGSCCWYGDMRNLMAIQL